MDFEVTDDRYLEGRLFYSLKVLKFIEEAVGRSSWSTIRSAAYEVLCQICKGITLLPPSLEQSKALSKVKQQLMPLVTTLLNSKESESKAGALNITGAVCGLGLDVGEAMSCVKVKDFLPQFRCDYRPGLAESRLFLAGSRLVTISLWQRIYQLSETDWDPTIRDAASVLVQLCAPRQQILQLLALQKEKYDTKLQALALTGRDPESDEEGSSSQSESSTSEDPLSQEDYFFLDH